MKVTQAINFKSLFTLRTLAMLTMVAMLAVSVAAQRQTKITLAPEAQPPNLDQCANGKASAPVNCVGGAWQNGNLNGQQAHWVEGESVAYRVSIPGTTGIQSTITIEYDTTKAGKHAIDYLTTYNRSAVADPCSDVTGVPCGAPSTFAIPIDVNVTNGQNGVLGGGDDIVQIPGVFTLFGGTIDAVSGYTLAGPYSGDSTTSITVTFTPSSANGTTVLAWGGHIATRLNWGIDMSAINISGSPYHMRIGGQDRSLSVDAVTYPAVVTIVKRVNNLNGTFDSTFVFGFTVTAGSANFGASSFTLVDSDPTQAGGGTRTNSNIVLFGSTNAIDISENNAHLLGGRYTLSDLSCSELPGGIPAVLNTTANFAAGSVHIVPDEGEFITCTFTNTEQRPSAAMVSVSGRVTTPDGRGLRNATVIMTDSLGNKRTVTTSSFGNYTFTDVAAGDVYVMGVSSKLYRFSTQLVQVNDTLTGVDFVGQE